MQAGLGAQGGRGHPGTTSERCSAETQGPEPVDGNRFSSGLAQLAEVRTGLGVEGVDASVAEVANEQCAAQSAEAGRCQRKPPRGVQDAARDQPTNEGTVGGEYVHEPVAPTGDVVTQGGVLLGVGDVELAGEFLNVERRVA